MLINETFSTQSLQSIADLANRGDIKQAKQALSSLMEKTPKDPEAWYLASFLMDQDDRKIQMLNKALNFDPNFAKAAQRLSKLTNPAESASFFAVTPMLSLPTEPQTPAVEIIPALAQSTAYARTNLPQRRGPNSILLGVLTLAVLVAAVGSIMTALSVNKISQSQPQQAKWAYLTLQYKQLQEHNIPNIGVQNADTSYYVSKIMLSDAILEQTLFGELVQCMNNAGINTSYPSLLLPADKQCFKEHSQDLSHVLSSLGANGWDLVSLINQSNQSEYAVEVVLKKQL